MPERKGRQIPPGSGLRHSVCWAPWSQDSKLLATGHMSPQDHKTIACRTESVSPWINILERDLINILWSRYLHMTNPFYALYPCFHTVFSSFKLARSLPFLSFARNKSYSISKCSNSISSHVSLHLQAATFPNSKVLQHWLLTMHFLSGWWDWGFSGTTPWAGLRQGVPFSELSICVPAFLCDPVVSWICVDRLLMDWWLLEWAWGTQSRVLFREPLLLCLCVPLGCP